MTSDIQIAFARRWLVSESGDIERVVYHLRVEYGMRPEAAREVALQAARSDGFARRYAERRVSDGAKPGEAIKELRREPFGLSFEEAGDVVRGLGSSLDNTND